MGRNTINIKLCRWKCESTFQYILAKQLYLKNICIPNVSMYTPGKREYEADFIYFNLKSRRLTEVEIKINKIDFQNDFNKPRYHDSEDVSYLYYALPSDVYEKHKDFIDSRLGDAGLILIDRKEDKDGVYFTFGGFKKKAKKRKNALPLTDDKILRYMRIGCMKWV